MSTLLIKNGRVLDPSQNIDKIYHVLVENGRIANIVENISDINHQNIEIIDVHGCCVAPGLVDMHIHLRDPGFTHKEDILTGCESASAGGFTSVCCMPNTKPACDTPETIKYIIEKSQSAKAKIYPVAAISQGLAGLEMNDLSKLKNAGAVGLSDDGRPVENPNMLMEAFKQAHKLGICVTCHCEDLDIINGGIINKGDISEKLGVKGMDRLSEDISTARDINLAHMVDAPVHIAHVSTEGSAEIIRSAKRRGIKVTAETAPHYLCLDDTLLLDKDANFRMNPPLRTQKDIKAMREAIIDGTIDAIATDHAPHSPDEKLDFEKAPNGIVGLETSLAVCISIIVKEMGVSLLDLIGLMSTNPAKIMNLTAGSLKIGSPADIVIFDPNEEWTVDREKFKSKSKNTPFHGKTLTGKVKFTILNGNIVYR